MASMQSYINNAFKMGQKYGLQPGHNVPQQQQPPVVNEYIDNDKETLTLSGTNSAARVNG